MKKNHVLERIDINQSNKSNKEINIKIFNIIFLMIWLILNFLYKPVTNRQNII